MEHEERIKNMFSKFLETKIKQKIEMEVICKEHYFVYFQRFRNLSSTVIWFTAHILWGLYLSEFNNNWDKVFKNGPSKICGRPPLKNLMRYGLPKADHTTFKFFKGCLPQILLGPFMNTSSQLWMTLFCIQYLNKQDFAFNKGCFFLIVKTESFLHSYIKYINCYGPQKNFLKIELGTDFLNSSHVYVLQ